MGLGARYLFLAVYNEMFTILGQLRLSGYAFYI
jgi:hypothetical protein